MNIGIIIPGVLGRMGSLIKNESESDARHCFVGGTVRPGHTAPSSSSESYYDNLDDVIQNPAAPCDAQVIIDFSSPEACETHLDAAVRHNIPVVIGTTGLRETTVQKIHEATQSIPILLAANTSLGANLLGALSHVATEALPESDIEISEIHHRKKKDAPSGTALMLGDIVATARNPESPLEKNCTRHGEALRTDGEVGIFGLRGGTVPGEHTVYFFLEGERIELTHRVQDRSIFAIGALAAARTIATQEPGLYSMMDVLGFS